jgi:hypothetical protein
MVLIDVIFPAVSGNRDQGEHAHDADHRGD